MKSEREEELTLTPSGFLFSRLLAAVEKEKKDDSERKISGQLELQHKASKQKHTDMHCS